MDVCVKNPLSRGDVIDVETAKKLQDVAKKLSEYRPVKHAHWEHNKDFFASRCSHCGACYNGLLSENYCSNCGAKMDEK